LFFQASPRGVKTLDTARDTTPATPPGERADNLSATGQQGDDAMFWQSDLSFMESSN
jgi:hypothetical protein